MAVPEIRVNSTCLSRPDRIDRIYNNNKNSPFSRLELLSVNFVNPVGVRIEEVENGACRGGRAPGRNHTGSRPLVADSGFLLARIDVLVEPLGQFGQRRNSMSRT